VRKNFNNSNIATRSYSRSKGKSAPEKKA